MCRSRTRTCSVHKTGAHNGRLVIARGYKSIRLVLGVSMRVHRAGHAASIPRRRHRIWPWVASILALLVVLLGVGGFFGLKLYSEAKQVKAHEEQAMQLLGGVTDLGNLDNLDTVSQQISQAKTETAAANEIAHVCVDGYDYFGGAFVRWPDWFCGCGNYRQRQDQYR